MRNIMVKEEMTKDEINNLNREQLSKLGICLIRVRPSKKCDDCKTNKFLCYMLDDRVWRQELKLEHSNNLCFNCMLKRLNRKLTASDFKQAPINECIIATIINNNA